MNGTFRQSMTWLHTWVGLVLCWILYFMFVTGTAGYFDNEIDRWMKPELPVAEPVSLRESLRVGHARLQQQAPDADRWILTPPSERETPYLRVFWQAAATETGDDAPERVNEQLDIDTGAPFAESARATGGGQTLYRMHYALHYIPFEAAFRVIGLITLLMFVGLVTGIVAHKKIFTSLFTFRPGRGQRSWLDMHNLMSVSTLPFQLMITYSGLIFVVTTWLPLIAFGSYGFDSGKAGALVAGLRGDPVIERLGSPAALAPLNGMTDAAIARWGPDSVRSIDIRFPGDANARVFVRRNSGVSALNETLVFDGVSGELLEARPAHPNGPLAFASTMIGLHEGLFASPALRWLYFLSGLLGAGMVATGAIYWAEKRKPKTAGAQSGFGYRLVEHLNVGIIAGLPLAISAYFWANRLLPTDLASREHWEVHCMFIVWGLCMLHPLFRTLHKAWTEQCWLAGLAFAGLPVVNALATEVHLAKTLAQDDWVLAGFDLTMLALGLVWLTTAAKLQRRIAGKKPPLDAIPARLA